MAQDYDKILKENLTNAVPFLLENLMQIKIAKVQNLELKLQYTLEREPDFLKIITDEKGKKYVF